MAEEFIPCWRIDRFSPGRKSFAFIDTAEYHADQLFINEEIQVKFKEDMQVSATCFNTNQAPENVNFSEILRLLKVK